MTYRGTVKNGVVVLDGAVTLSDGTVVQIEPIDVRRPQGSSSPAASPLFGAPRRARPTGIPDLAINHDHYLYGHPKVSDG